MQDVPPVALQPTDDIPAKRFLSAKKSVICDVRMEEFTLKKLTALISCPADVGQYVCLRVSCFYRG